MIQPILLTIIVSFLLNILVLSVFDITVFKEQAIMQLIVLALVGSLVYLLVKKIDMDMEKLINKIIIYSYVFVILIFLFKIGLYVYEIGIYNTRSFLIIGLAILSIIILYNVYLINKTIL